MVEQTRPDQGKRCSTGSTVESYAQIRHKEKVMESLHNAGLPMRHSETGERHGKEWIKMRDGLGCRLAHPKGSQGILVALIGPRGTGKTQLAIDVLRQHVVNTGCLSRYTKLFGLALEIKATYDGKGSEIDVLNTFIKPKILIIDEIHEKLDSQWARGFFTHLIDRRYDGMKDTFLIGNLEESEFAGVVGSSVYSRLQETGGVINCDWDSFRKKGGEE